MQLIKPPLKGEGDREAVERFTGGLAARQKPILALDTGAVL